jgi:hypothetical protein
MHSAEGAMFPIATSTLSFGEIAEYWSREIRPTATWQELLGTLESAYWLGELRGISGPTRLQRLKNMFTSLRHRDDLGIVFIAGDCAVPHPLELPDGSLKVDLRHQIRVPSANTDSWDDAECSDAYRTLAKTCSNESYPELTVGFTLIELTYEEFEAWRTKRGYHKQSFWQSTLKKPKRGRPAEYNWDGVRTKLIAYVSEFGPIRTVEELLQKCGDFASDLHPKEKRPDDKTIREAIRTHALDTAAEVARGK